MLTASLTHRKLHTPKPTCSPKLNPRIPFSQKHLIARKDILSGVCPVLALLPTTAFAILRDPCSRSWDSVRAATFYLISHHSEDSLETSLMSGIVHVALPVI